VGPDLQKITLQTKELEVCDGEYVDIPACSWDSAIEEIKSVTIVAEDLSVQPHLIPASSIGSFTCGCSLSKSEVIF
jgi:hypothetical protein